MTNYERIMQDITIDMIANRFGHINVSHNGCPKGTEPTEYCTQQKTCRDCWLDYLKQEVGE